MVVFSLASDDYHVYVMRRKAMPSRITVAVCVSMAGVGGSGRPLPGGTVILAISDILFFALVFVLEVRLLWSFLGLAQ